MIKFLTERMALQRMQLQAVRMNQFRALPISGLIRPQQQQQQQAEDGGNDATTEKLTVDGVEIEVPKSAVAIFENRGRGQAAQAFIEKAIKSKPEGMNISTSEKPGQIIDRIFGLVNQHGETISGLQTQLEEAKANADKPPTEQMKTATDEITKLRKELSVKDQAFTTQSADVEKAKVEMYREFAIHKSVTEIMSSAMRDFHLSENSAGLYSTMISQAFEFEVIDDGQGNQKIVYTEKGKPFPFQPGGNDPTSKDLAEVISKMHPGNHGTGVPEGLSSQASSGGAPNQKITIKTPTRQAEEKVWK